MNGTKNTLDLRHVVVMFTHHPCLFLCSVLVIFAFGCAWYSCRGENISAFPTQWPLFPPRAKVLEITNGSLDTLSSFLSHSSLKFVLYYAPWCGQSRKTIPEFIRTANVLHQEVTFIAINCWTGSCRKEYSLDSYPKLFAYHTSFPGVQYPEDNDLNSLYMVRFLQDIVRPFSHFGREQELHEVQSTRQEVVLSYLDNIERKDYLRFFSTALSFVGQASKPLFGLVTDTVIANRVGLNQNGVLVYYRALHPTVVYQPLRNTSVQNITSWISKSRKELITELVPTPTNRDSLASQLSDKPAVILFLPLRKRRISAPLLNIYTRAASEYNNCSCEKNIQRPKPDDKSKQQIPFTQVNLDNIRPSRTQNVKQHTVCGSLVLTDSRYSRHNVCEVCQTCTTGCHYHHGDVLDVIRNRLRRNRPLIGSPCGSVRTFYYPIFRASVCCRGFVSPGLRRERVSKDALDKDFGHFLGSLYDKVLKVVEPLQKQLSADDENLSGLEATKKMVGQSVAPAVSTVNVSEHNNKVNESAESPDVSQNTSDGCNRTGHVARFRGASCYSNRSVNFFYMDSERFWSVAERLGVKLDSSTNNKVSLVVVDIKNEVHHVMNESLSMNNHTMVEFVMSFMNSRLKRAMRSADIPRYTCPESHACVVEVTSATLDDIVMDDNKDVLLVYFAPWCGFCISLAPVLLTVARFFKGNKHVTIARIDADQNDLPWQHTVTSYPTIILFPAKRKDFSVRFPNESERTAEALIKFIVQHGSEATRNVLYGKPDAHCDSDVIRAKFDHLESRLRRTEQEKELLEARLEGIVMEKSLLGFKNSRLIKGMSDVRKSVTRERDSRISIQTMYEQAEKSRRQSEDKYLTAVLQNAQLQSELTHLEIELATKEDDAQTKANELRRLMIVKIEMEQMKDKVAKKLEKAAGTIVHLQTRGKFLSRKIRRLQSSYSELHRRVQENSVRKMSRKKEMNELKEEKRLLGQLVSDAEVTIEMLKASLKSSRERLDDQTRRHDSVVDEKNEADEKLEKMKINYDKLTVILSRIDLPKK